MGEVDGNDNLTDEQIDSMTDEEIRGWLDSRDARRGDARRDEVARDARRDASTANAKPLPSADEIGKAVGRELDRRAAERAFDPHRQYTPEQIAAMKPEELQAWIDVNRPSGGQRGTRKFSFGDQFPQEMYQNAARVGDGQAGGPGSAGGPVVTDRDGGKWAKKPFGSGPGGR